jgi:hypothetical protein
VRHSRRGWCPSSRRAPQLAQRTERDSHVIPLTRASCCAYSHPDCRDRSRGAAAGPAPAGFRRTTDGGGGETGCVLGPLCGLGDLSTWLQQTIQHVVSDFLSGLAIDIGDAIVGFINDVNFLTHTPENLSYNDGLVKQFITATQVLADGLLAVVVLVSGYNIMLRPYMGSTYAGALDFLPRLLLGGILINTAAWWCRLAIDANNAACTVFGAPTISDVVAGALRITGDPIAGLLMVLILVVMTILLVVQQLMRLALVDVLLILAPLAALLWILPQSQAWGRLWGRLFVGTVFAQTVQVLTLRLGFNLATGLPSLSVAGLLQPLLGIAVLALALKIPSLMGGGAAGGNIVASLLGTAAGAAVGSGVGVGVRAALGAGSRTVGRRS